VGKSTGLIFGQMLKARGVTVVNDPMSLVRATSKVYIRPRSLVTRDPEAISSSLARSATPSSSKLLADGRYFVGIDVIGDKVVEINAESTGGMQSVERLRDRRLPHRHRSPGAPHRLEVLSQGPSSTRRAYPVPPQREPDGDRN
jgi:glutathione synthase/RimK-type ligase-like ATP-grasp enzyme